MDKKKEEKFEFKDKWKALRFMCSFPMAFFKGVTEVAWGIASIFLMNGLLLYFKVDSPTISPIFFNLAMFIGQNINWFVLTFFVFYLFRYIKESIEE